MKHRGGCGVPRRIAIYIFRKRLHGPNAPSFCLRAVPFIRGDIYRLILLFHSSKFKHFNPPFLRYRDIAPSRSPRHRETTIGRTLIIRLGGCKSSSRVLGIAVDLGKFADRSRDNTNAKYLSSLRKTKRYRRDIACSG